MGGVRLEKINKHFGKVKAVDNLSIEVKDKEFLTLLGPSGCGKTTTLEIVAGLQNPTSGNVFISGELVNDVPPQKRNIAMVFQSYALYPHMKVYDNMAFGLKLRKIPKQEIEKRVKETAKLLGITHLLERKPKELSGGEKQRVALGRAIVRKPAVFLMDEPLSNLDAKLRVYMRAELVRLHRRLKTTLIYVTHDQIEATAMSDRIAILNYGRLQQIDNPSEIYKHPANLFVAGFIGAPSMNFIDCSLVHRGDKSMLDCASFTYELEEDLQKVLTNYSTGSELILGVRPEDITIHKDPRRKSIEANVLVAQLQGAQQLVQLEIGEHLIMGITSAETLLKMGEKVYITLKKDKIHIFSKKSQETLV